MRSGAAARQTSTGQGAAALLAGANLHLHASTRPFFRH